MKVHREKRLEESFLKLKIRTLERMCGPLDKFAERLGPAGL